MMGALGNLITVELRVNRILDRHDLGVVQVEVWQPSDASTLDVHEEAEAAFFQECEAVGGYRRSGIDPADWEWVPTSGIEVVNAVVVDQRDVV